MAADQISHMLGRHADEIEIMAAGMNHFQWVWDIRDNLTGADLYSEFRCAEKAYEPSYMPYVRRIFRAFGLYPTCSDDHLGEYQAYGWEAGVHGYDFDGDELGRINTKALIADIVSGRRSASELFTPSGEKAVETICAIQFNERRYIPAAIVYNGGAMPQLPDDVAVEIPVIADSAGIHKLAPPLMPDGVVGMLNNQVSAQRMSIRAAKAGSKELALQALLCDPAVNSITAAEALNDELFEINRPYIRPF
jgi:alpha-galactosidase